MTEQIIRRFTESGKAQGGKLIQIRETIHKALMGRMKDEGYARLFDLDPVWKWDWDKDDIYDFTYTIQGVYVGKERAWQTEGILGGKPIISTPKIK